MKNKGFSGDVGARGVDGWACRQQTHLPEEARVQTVSHLLTREFQRPEIGGWEGIFWRGFHRKVNRREALLLVCSSAEMEVVGKSCRRQGVPTMVWLL